MIHHPIDKHLVPIFIRNVAVRNGSDTTRAFEWHIIPLKSFTNGFLYFVTVFLESIQDRGVFLSIKQIYVDLTYDLALAQKGKADVDPLPKIIDVCPVSSRR